jgi:hypothetical protein
MCEMHVTAMNLQNLWIMIAPLSLASILSDRRSLGRRNLDGRSLDGRSLDGRSPPHLHLRIDLLQHQDHHLLGRLGNLRRCQSGDGLDGDYACNQEHRSTPYRGSQGLRHQKARPLISLEVEAILV